MRVWEWDCRTEREATNRKKIERGMVKVRCNDFGWRPAVLFADSETLKGFFCWFCSLPLMCNLLLGFVIFVWHQPTSKWRGLSDTNTQALSVSYWRVLKYDGTSGFDDNATFSVLSYEENKWKVKSLMKGGWVGFVGSIIICGSVCCASVQSGYNHLLSLSLYIYPHLFISCSFLNGVRESVPCKEAKMCSSD